MKRSLILFVLLMSSCAPLPTEEPVTVSTEVIPTPSLPPATPTSAPAQPTSVPAGVIHVDSFEQEVYPFTNNGNCTLSEAITAANTLQPVDACSAGLAEGSTIELMAGTYLLKTVDESPAFHLDGKEWDRRPNQLAGLPVLMSRVTVHGNGAVIQAERNTMPAILITYSPEAVIENLTLSGGGMESDPEHMVSYDTGNYWNAGNAVLNHIRIENGIADDGAGVANGSGSLEMTDCIVNGNSARHQGGGIRSNGSLIITTSVIEKNTAREGAGISLHGGDITIMDSDVNENFAESGGGGILIDPLKKPVTLAFQDSRVTRNATNDVNGMGGGILLASDHYADFEIEDHANDIVNESSAKVEIGNTKIEGNMSAGGGGIAWADRPESQLNISRKSSLSRNTAGSVAYGGGAIFNYGGNIHIEESTLDENYSFNGGAIYTRSGMLAIENSIFTLNVSETNEKGAVFVATGFGGAILNEGGKVTIERSVFRLNRAIFGGAVYYTPPGLSKCMITPESFTTIQNSCFLSNDASYDVKSHPQGDQIFLQECLNPAKNPSMDAMKNWWGESQPTDQNQVFGKVSLAPILNSPPSFCQ